LQPFKEAAITTFNLLATGVTKLVTIGVWIANHIPFVKAIFGVLEDIEKNTRKGEEAAPVQQFLRDIAAGRFRGPKNTKL
jgi:hypothetical protein